VNVSKGNNSFHFASGKPSALHEESHARRRGGHIRPGKREKERQKRATDRADSWETCRRSCIEGGAKMDTLEIREARGGLAKTKEDKNQLRNPRQGTSREQVPASDY